MRPTRLPSHSVSWPASSARNAAAYAATSAHRAGRWASMSWLVKPEPSTTSVRPGASAASVASAPAVATTWRSRGVIAHTPSAMREVRWAASASVIHGSARNAGES